MEVTFELDSRRKQPFFQILPDACMHLWKMVRIRSIERERCPAFASWLTSNDQIVLILAIRAMNLEFFMVSVVIRYPDLQNFLYSVVSYLCAYVLNYGG